MYRWFKKEGDLDSNRNDEGKEEDMMTMSYGRNVVTPPLGLPAWVLHLLPAVVYVCRPSEHPAHLPSKSTTTTIRRNDTAVAHHSSQLRTTTIRLTFSRNMMTLLTDQSSPSRTRTRWITIWTIVVTLRVR
ncbi:hypothetical protein HD806DRAFT_40427 [Xylariaceae sp. AK1471]|nr:hypothetical protein HD806DRAFT_40427 [Xylariaceae sp. AK1471]